MNRLLQVQVSLFHTSSSLLRGTKNLDWLRRTTSRLERNATAPRAPVFPSEPLHGRKRARAFFDIGLSESGENSQKVGGSNNSNSADNSNSGASSASSTSAPTTKTGSSESKSGLSERVVFELADDIVPLSSENFLRLCERPQGAGYSGSELFKVQKGFAIFVVSSFVCWLWLCLFVLAGFLAVHSDDPQGWFGRPLRITVIKSYQ